MMNRTSQGTPLSAFLSPTHPPRVSNNTTPSSAALSTTTFPIFQASTTLNRLDFNSMQRRNPTKTVPMSNILVEMITKSAPQESHPKSPNCQRQTLRGHNKETHLLQNAPTNISPSLTILAAAKITSVPQALLEVFTIDVQSTAGNSPPLVHTPSTQSVLCHPQQV
mmetsp:Transcript_2727/g.6104  ORF Transcript_2727/g.6104 Transcript_2727/m.6104 type:complete len:166 (+) Transcript_2727:959-1456(+)